MNGPMALRLSPRHPLSFDATLSALQGLLGQHVLISVGPSSAPEAVVGSMSGCFTHAVETTETYPGAPEEWCLSIEGEAETGVFLDRSRFHGSRWVGDDRGGIQITVDELLVTIEPWSV